MPEEKVKKMTMVYAVGFLLFAWAFLALLLYGVCLVFVHTLGHLHHFDGNAFFAEHYLYFLVPSALVSAVTIYLGTR